MPKVLMYFIYVNSLASASTAHLKKINLPKCDSHKCFAVNVLTISSQLVSLRVNPINLNKYVYVYVLYKSEV